MCDGENTDRRCEVLSAAWPGLQWVESDDNRSPDQRRWGVPVPGGHHHRHPDPRHQAGRHPAQGHHTRLQREARQPQGRCEDLLWAEGQCGHPRVRVLVRRIILSLVMMIIWSPGTTTTPWSTSPRVWGWPPARRLARTGRSCGCRPPTRLSPPSPSSRLSSTTPGTTPAPPHTPPATPSGSTWLRVRKAIPMSTLSPLTVELYKEENLSESEAN